MTLMLSSESASAELPETAPRPRILIVEDDPDQLQLVRIYLRRSGYHVDLAVSGEIANALIAAGNIFDAALIDVLLPGIDGVAVASLLRDLQPNCQIVLTSVVDPAELPTRWPVLPKPYTRSDILAFFRHHPPAISPAVSPE
jgi:CheY-like chemotaxis protein